MKEIYSPIAGFEADMDDVPTVKAVALLAVIAGCAAWAVYCLGSAGMSLLLAVAA